MEKHTTIDCCAQIADLTALLESSCGFCLRTILFLGSLYKKQTFKYAVIFMLVSETSCAGLMPIGGIGTIWRWVASFLWEKCSKKFFHDALEANPFNDGKLAQPSLHCREECAISPAFLDEACSLWHIWLRGVNQISGKLIMSAFAMAFFPWRASLSDFSTSSLAGVSRLWWDCSWKPRVLPNQ